MDLRFHYKCLMRTHRLTYIPNISNKHHVIFKVPRDLDLWQSGLFSCRDGSIAVLRTVQLFSPKDYDDIRGIQFRKKTKKKKLVYFETTRYSFRLGCLDQTISRPNQMPCYVLSSKESKYIEIGTLKRVIFEGVFMWGFFFFFFG